MENIINNYKMKSTETLQIYESNKAMIDSQVATAKQFPRNIKTVLDNCIAIVTYNEDIAKTCTYSVPRGTKSISGPSINCAKIIMQNFGNFRAEARVVEEDAKRITCEAVAFDLENNVAVKVQVKRMIVGSNGQRFNEDMITVTGNAGNSIALRNAIFAVIPKSIVDLVYSATKEKIIGKITDENMLKTKRKLVIDGFKNAYGLTEIEILKKIGRENIDHVTKDDILILVGVETAIKEGDTTVEMAFRPETVKRTSSDDMTPREKRLIEQLNNCTSETQLEALKPNVRSNAERGAWEAKKQQLKTKK